MILSLEQMSENAKDTIRVYAEVVQEVAGLSLEQARAAGLCTCRAVETDAGVVHAFHEDDCCYFVARRLRGLE